MVDTVSAAKPDETEQALIALALKVAELERENRVMQRRLERLEQANLMHHGKA